MPHLFCMPDIFKLIYYTFVFPMLFLYNLCMKIFAISDLHLSLNNPKPMDIFGMKWDNYVERICADWRARVGDDDIVLIAGDISWAMYLEKAVPDLQFIGALPGHKVILRGNHDYWWKSISLVREALPVKMYAVQNDAVRIGDNVICGSRGWTVPETAGAFESEQDKKIYLRECERLKLSFTYAQRIRKTGDRLICMTHYPPFNLKREDSDYTALIGAAGAEACVYGHLHGYNTRKDNVITKGGVRYILTSCDLIGNKLAEIF